MKPRLSPIESQILRQHLDAVMGGLRSDRLSWWAHWAQLSENYLPRRYKWFVTPNQFNRGSQMNMSIVDETGVIAARTLAAGLVTGLTSPTRPWFRLGLHDFDAAEGSPARIWLDEVQKRMLRVFAGSNFYQSIGTLYHDNVIFGSADMLIYEDPEQVVRCYNPCLGEFFFASNNRLVVDSQYREFTLTTKQVVDEFQLENCSDSVAQSYRSGGASRVREVVIAHAIEPNTRLWQDGVTPMRAAVPAHFAYRECYWESGSQGQSLLRCMGYHEKPFVGLRWDVTSNDSYGRSPGMDGLPAVRQLQIEQRRKAEAIDKLVRPPMVAGVSMKNEPASILPGAVTYVADVTGAGFKPAYQVDPRLAEMVEDIKEVQARVNAIFYVDLFMMISQLDTVRTATEIDARREEKLVMLGPVIERTENECLDVIINRVYAIMSRRGLLPEAPAEIAGQELSIQYISMLAEAQRVASTAAIERLFNMVGYAAGVNPAVLDNVNFDEAIEQYAEALGVSPKILHSAKEVAQLRMQRAAQQQMQQAAEGAMAATEGAKTLSETDVGGGQNALQAMLFGPGAAA